MDTEIAVIGLLESSVFRYELWSDRSWVITFAGMRNRGLEGTLSRRYADDYWWTGQTKPADRILTDLADHIKYFAVDVKKVEIY